RPNRQVKGHGLAVLQPDVAGEWTRRITLKYLHGSAGEKRDAAWAAMPRIVIELRPERLITHQTPWEEAPEAAEGWTAQPTRQAKRQGQCTGMSPDDGPYSCVQ